MKPIMYVVAGPSGSGKSSAVPVRKFNVDYFNADDTASICKASPLKEAQLTTVVEHGLGGLSQETLRVRQYHGISPDLRAHVINPLCESFIRHHTVNRISFAVETTLRSTIALDQMLEAKRKGFHTEMTFIGTGNVEINIARVTARARDGEHSAPISKIRDVFNNSLQNLRQAFGVADKLILIDNTTFAQEGVEIVPFAIIENMEVTSRLKSVPQWGQDALDDLVKLAQERDRRTAKAKAIEDDPLGR